MNTGFYNRNAALAPTIWPVGALCRAIADSLDARFNPVAVRGEISGFTRASSGHCYFSLKDASGQLRCAMFRRAAGLIGFNPREGDEVEVRGRLGVYEARGDLQLIVESMARAGQGQLFEQFLRLKAQLEAEGLFDATRKRPLPAMPRGIGLVTSLGAAALHDVLTALARRVPHIPVVLSPAPVQGPGAPEALINALSLLYEMAQESSEAQADPAEDSSRIPIDLILLVRGGGSIEDLWAFNDESLARAILRSPVPVVVGVGHETDFSIADFVADLRAPTPTAAAELASVPQEVLRNAQKQLSGRLAQALRRRLDAEAQRLDIAQGRMGRPSARLAGEHRQIDRQAQRLVHAARIRLERERSALTRLAERLARTPVPYLAREGERIARTADRLPQAAERALVNARERLDRAGLRLAALDPQRVLERGYAWLEDENAHPVTHAAAAHPGQRLRAILADGKVDLNVLKSFSG
ncbi:exodeoxyribonuclease VII large subunit [Ottowia caeni]|uniref:exodeoxyribonuclease VII large subunit n=1 Tax=Ottowia caeni TaxID=2870339 RepID=UPI001E287F92|nr:exodeoxyribonuclease VII large subunit [Ottowia caeni]